MIGGMLSGHVGCLVPAEDDDGSSRKTTRDDDSWERRLLALDLGRVVFGPQVTRLAFLNLRSCM